MTLKAVKGNISFSVRVRCQNPECRRFLNLNEYPYGDDGESEYSESNEALHKAIFGTKANYAQWDNLEIEFKCCICETPFKLNSIEY